MLDKIEFTPENWYYRTAQEAQIYHNRNDFKKRLLIQECYSILEKEIFNDCWYITTKSMKYRILLDRKRNIDFFSIEQLEKMIDDFKKPEPYKHTLFFIVIYFKSLELDPEWLSTMYITTLAIEKETRIKNDMKELKELEKQHKNKYWTLLSKIKNYLW